MAEKPATNTDKALQSVGRPPESGQELSEADLEKVAKGHLDMERSAQLHGPTVERLNRKVGGEPG